MKTLISIVLSLSLYASYAQSEPITTGNATYDGAYKMFYETPNDTEGSNYLFENWENRNIIHFKSGDKIIKNINIKDNTFELKVDEKSVLILNPNEFNYITINSKNYKHYFSQNISRIFEIIYKSKKLELLKGFDLNFHKGHATPYDTNPIDKYVINEVYFVKTKDFLKQFKLNKKSILDLLTNKKSEVKEFVKKKQALLSSRKRC